MKFFVNNDLKRDTHLKSAVTFLLLLITLFLISNIIVKGLHFGFDIQTIHTTLVGNEEQFIEPHSLDTLLETVHIDLFFSSMIYLIIAGLGLRIAKYSNALKINLFILLVLIIVASISPFIAFNNHPLATAAWLYSFILSHMMFIVFNIFIVIRLWKKYD